MDYNLIYILLTTLFKNLAHISFIFARKYIVLRQTYALSPMPLLRLGIYIIRITHSLIIIIVN